MRVGLYPLLFIFFLILNCTVGYGQLDKFENKIVAVVNEDVITQADLDIALAAVITEYRQSYSGDELAVKIEEARQEILNQMIEDRLILQEAKRYKIEVDEAEVEERLNDVRSRFSSDSDFDDALNESGITFDILKNRYREQIMMGRLVNYEVREKVVVTPTEISEYYANHTDEFNSQGSAHLKNIVIRFEGDDLLAKQKVDDIYRLINEGRDFSDVARQYSQGQNAQEGGELGFVEKGQMRKEFDDVVFNLEPGEVSPPIKTETGYYIFKVVEKKGSYLRSLPEVRTYIENLIFQEKAKKRYKEWMDKLRRNAFIQLK
ncbi:MAG: hypothetical protein AMJ78_03330 [Omnitrophica WOR_2 bacterium SM23_29]|nr:MAG: hypothetical protein AMJ78_03330 [Omnitrophica WOR_2 bacterium SM23_29]